MGRPYLGIDRYPPYEFVDFSVSLVPFVLLLSHFLRWNVCFELHLHEWVFFHFVYFALCHSVYPRDLVGAVYMTFHSLTIKEKRTGYAGTAIFCHILHYPAID